VAPAATLTLLDEDSPSVVPAVFGAAGVRLAPEAVHSALGWELTPAGLCRGDTCVPVRPEHRLVHPDGIDLVALAGLLDRPLAFDLDERIACLGASAAVRGQQLRSLVAELTRFAETG